MSSLELELGVIRARGGWKVFQVQCIIHSLTIDFSYCYICFTHQLSKQQKTQKTAHHFLSHATNFSLLYPYFNDICSGKLHYLVSPALNWDPPYYVHKVESSSLPSYSIGKEYVPIEQVLPKEYCFVGQSCSI